MKHLIALLVVSFVAVAAAQAGEACCKAKSACSTKAKTVKKADTSVRGAQLLVRK